MGYKMKITKEEKNKNERVISNQMQHETLNKTSATSATKRDLRRFVKWPRYIRIQRQLSLIRNRSKKPAGISLISKACEESQAVSLFKLLARYHPIKKNST